MRKNSILKIIIISAIILTTIAALTACGKKKSDETHDEKKPAETKTASEFGEYTSDDGSLKIEKVYYMEYKSSDDTVVGFNELYSPTISGDTEEIKKINKFYSDLWEHAKVTDYSGEIEAKDTDWYTSANYEFKQSYVKLGYQATYYEPGKLVSFLERYELDEYLRVIPKIQETGQVWNIETGNRVKLTDIYPEFTYDVVYNCLLEHYKKGLKKAHETSATEEVTISPEAQLEADITQYLDMDGLNFYLDKDKVPYVILDYVEYTDKVKIAV
ncbi:MAG: hypothetical protein LBL93_00705 [Ruminococcus sp.]|jgi:predicted small lipoprotein YifL|nr:hypothetical protein [Ruminococcus sp.]